MTFSAHYHSANNLNTSAPSPSVCEPHPPSPLISHKSGFLYRSPHSPWGDITNSFSSSSTSSSAFPSDHTSLTVPVRLAVLIFEMMIKMIFHSLNQRALRSSSSQSPSSSISGNLPSSLDRMDGLDVLVSGLELHFFSLFFWPDVHPTVVTVMLKLLAAILCASARFKDYFLTPPTIPLPSASSLPNYASATMVANYIANMSLPDILSGNVAEANSNGIFSQGFSALFTHVPFCRPTSTFFVFLFFLLKLLFLSLV
jgi:hypothetical protein